MAIQYKELIGGFQIDGIKVQEKLYLNYLAGDVANKLLIIQTDGSVSKQDLPTTVSAPNNQIVYGTGTGFSSTTNFMYDGNTMLLGSTTSVASIKFLNSLGDVASARIDYTSHNLQFITDFDKVVFLINQTGIQFPQLTGANTDMLTVGPTGVVGRATAYTDEQVRDTIGAMIQNGTGITWNYDDAANTMTGNVSLNPFSTTNLVEGLNLYYTQARFDSAFTAKSTNNLTEGGTNLYYTQARFDFAFNLKSTTNLAEGTNLYYTNARADARITAQKGVANGIATLDSGGKVPTSQLPALAITTTFPVASQAAMLALTAEMGDVAIRTDLSKSFILGGGGNPTVLADWQELLSPTGGGGGITSINGLTGPVVTITTTNIGEGTNLYYTDARVQTFGDGRYILAAGKAGGQTVNGDTAASGNLILQSTTNATKGKILFGVSGNYVFDGVNGRFGIGQGTPLADLHIEASSGVDRGILIKNTGVGSGDTPAVKLQNSGYFASIFLGSAAGSGIAGFYTQAPNGFGVYNSSVAPIFRALQNQTVIFDGYTGTGNRLTHLDGSGLLVRGTVDPGLIVLTNANNTLTGDNIFTGNNTFNATSGLTTIGSGSTTGMITGNRLSVIQDISSASGTSTVNTTRANQTVATTGIIMAEEVCIRTAHTSGTVAEARGFMSIIDQNSTQPVSEIKGAFFGALVSNALSGLITNFKGASVQFAAGAGASGTVTNYYGFYNDIPGGTGSLTIINRWGFFNNDGNATNHFKGPLQLPNLGSNITDKLLGISSTGNGDVAKITAGSNIAFASNNINVVAPDTQIIYGVGGLTSASSSSFTWTDSTKRLSITGDGLITNTKVDNTAGFSAGNFFTTHTWGTVVAQAAGAVYSSLLGISTMNINAAVVLGSDQITSAGTNILRLGSAVSAAATVTQVGSSKRAASANAVMVQLNSNSSSSIVSSLNHVAGMQIFAPQASNGTGVASNLLTSIINYYGLLIGDSQEYANASAKITNRWGIYQGGPSDANTLKGPTNVDNDLEITGSGKSIIVTDTVVTSNRYRITVASGVLTLTLI